MALVRAKISIINLPLSFLLCASPYPGGGVGGFRLSSGSTLGGIRKSSGSLISSQVRP